MNALADKLSTQTRNAKQGYAPITWPHYLTTIMRPYVAVNLVPSGVPLLLM